MAKNFEPRVSKKQRKTIDIASKLNKDFFKISDQKLLDGAKLREIELCDIDVKEQVRTKFNDDSLKDLAANIQTNGLIQPLVLHKSGLNKYRLVCGERRFRAMNINKMEKAPCFVLDSKTEQELMAIQFSENSSREELHYIDKADGILNYRLTTNASERKIQTALGISKSEVHRSLILAKLSPQIKEAAKKYEIEKYVLVEFDALDAGLALKQEIEKSILAGEITKRSELQKVLRANKDKNKVIRAQKGKKKTATTKKKASVKKKQTSLDATALLKAMEGDKPMKFNAKTKKLLKSLIEEAGSTL
ncbi:MAG: ParB/RepB/Spo0J family partition protein [Bacteriovoracaceae bacterium]|nr:ParB/RepB/Spo0J family partition protein [Bacteriovoracaceae bacterium]